MKKLSRREFIKHSAASSCALAAAGIVPGLGLRVARAATPNGRFLLIIWIEEGFDGLYLMQPMTTDFILNLRLAIKRPLSIEADGNLLALAGTNWGVRNALQVFQDTWNANELAVINGVGVPNMVASTPFARKVMGAGIHNAQLAAGSGWIQRLMQTSQTVDPYAVLDFARGGHLMTAGGTFRPLKYESPTTVRGVRTDQQLNNESSFRPDMLAVAAKQAHAYAQPQEIAVNNHLSDYGDQYDDLNETFTPLPGGYGGNAFEQKVRQVDGVLRDVDTNGRPSIGVIDYAGWNTHTDVSDLDTRLTELNRALSNLRANLIGAGLWNTTAVLLGGNHGTRIDENASGGIDNAPTQMMFCMGGAVRGGTYGNFVTRTEIDAALGYLNLQINAVDVFHDLVRGLGYNANAVFPGYTPTPLNLLL